MLRHWLVLHAEWKLVFCVDTSVCVFSSNLELALPIFSELSLFDYL